MIRILFACLALAWPVSHAHAQSIDLATSGRVALGYTDMSDGKGYAAVDITLTVPLSRRVPLSFEIGTYLFGLEGKRPHETYAALVWNDTWRLGAVRPAYDHVLPSVFERVAPYLAYDRAEYARGFTTVEAMRRTAVPWGASYQGAAGNTRWAFSLHDASKGTLFRSASVAMAYETDTWSVAGAVEGVWSREDDFSGINAKLGGRIKLGKLDMGLTYLHPEANKRPDALALDIAYAVTDRLTLRAMGEFTETGADDAYGIALDYRVRDNSSIIFAATEDRTGSGMHFTFEQRF